MFSHASSRRSSLGSTHVAEGIMSIKGRVPRQSCPFPIPPDRISASSPRVVGDARARALCTDMKRCSYYETCATYGLNVDRVFQEGEYGSSQHAPVEIKRA